jgi:hypothetical protein
LVHLKSKIRDSRQVEQKTKRPDRIDRGRWFMVQDCGPPDDSRLGGLVLAAVVKNGQNHQVGIGEQPFFGLRTGGLRSPSKESEVLAAGKALEVVNADSREPRDFICRKQLLAGLDGDQLNLSPILDAADIVNAATEV